ncbi:hypothetical protein PYW08_009676 [Mythimna loreyi]|uniref:Uncharacterized protein n=1 Tax=Mythimna loreyi TaxID=667449 RepID=A0ACC2Q6Q6_9NEOP|nr:hypothetical protein PYW08_009676 [Mythimna loreyi]
MFAIQSNIVWFFIFIHVSNCQRRIQNGMKVTGEKPYVVYLVKAPRSKILYDYWLCGGALVTTDLVVTSAACIRDVDFLYVIAGYNKYVPDKDIDIDPCTSKMKKKVIYTCYPEGYDLKYERLDAWSFIDIGVAKVESPYDFKDQSYKTLCSYIPGTIPINTEEKYQRAGTDAIVVGWGHRAIWRKPEDKANYNEQDLNYASVLILNKHECANHYDEYGQMSEVIRKYMLCTLADGGIDEFGIPLPTEEGILPYGCSQRRSLANNTNADLEEECEYVDEEDTRRGRIKKSSNVSVNDITTKNDVNKIAVETNKTESKKKDLTKRKAELNKRTHSTKSFRIADRTPKPNKTNLTNANVSSNKTFRSRTFRNTRRNGICQNDHGGPIVTWIGSHEILIGVASVFKVSKDFLCEGPYLYTSTQCNGAFLDCILAKTDFNNFENDRIRILPNGTDNYQYRRTYCRKSSNDKGHPTNERHISWMNHPAGPADHERHLVQDNKPDVKEQMPKNVENVNKNGISQVNEQYSPIQYRQKFSVNVGNDPNKKYVMDKNIAPIVNQRDAPNNDYVANYQYPPSNGPGIMNNNNSPYNGPGIMNNNNSPYNGPGIMNNNNSPYNGPGIMNNNNSPYNGPASNNGPVSNNAHGQVNGPALSYMPPINYKSQPNNDYVLRKGPELKTEYERINNYASNNGPALQDRKPASFISPKPVYKYLASNRPMMRPTVPLRT